MNSSKRRLAWSPETPKGRSRKYSIGETASPSLKQRISGVISLNRRFAIPSGNQEVEGANTGMEGLILEDDSKSANIQQLKKKKKKNSPTLVSLKTGVRSSRGRTRRNTSKRVDPKQKLISDMMPERSMMEQGGSKTQE